MINTIPTPITSDKIFLNASRRFLSFMICFCEAVWRILASRSWNEEITKLNIQDLAKIQFLLSQHSPKTVTL